MDALADMLSKREGPAADFTNPECRIRCYAHVINICASHVISSTTSISEEYLAELKVPFDSNRSFRDDFEDESIELQDNELISNPSFKDVELKLDDLYDGDDDSGLEDWFTGIKRDPLRRARRIIRLLRSSDRRRTAFREYIQKCNTQGLFLKKGDNGVFYPVKVPELQLLRDVKTRWDSVYLMLERLRRLRVVSPSRRLELN